MAKTTLRKLEETLNTIETRANQELTELYTKLEITEKTMSNALEDSKKAQDEGNVEAYSNAMADHRAAIEITKMYKGKIEKVSAKPLITKEEYQELKQGIIESMDEVIRKNTEKLMPIIDELVKLRDDLSSELNKGNEMLHKVQRQLYKEPKVRKYITEYGTEGTNVGPDDKYLKTGSLGFLNNTIEKINQMNKGE